MCFSVATVLIDSGFSIFSVQRLVGISSRKYQRAQELGKLDGFFWICCRVVRRRLHTIYKLKLCGFPLLFRLLFLQSEQQSGPFVWSLCLFLKW